MPIEGNYLFIAAMDVEAEREALFNEVYETEHVPLISKVPGVLSVARFQRQDFSLIMGGERRTIHLESEPRYSAVYGLESPEVLVSDAFAEAVDAGRWPEQVRPYTKNRRHNLIKLI